MYRFSKSTTYQATKEIQRLNTVCIKVFDYDFIKLEINNNEYI